MNLGNKLTTSDICLAHDLLSDISLLITTTRVTREVQIFISFLLVLQRTTSHRQLIYMNCIQLGDFQVLKIQDLKGEMNLGNKLTTSDICLAHDLLSDISLLITTTRVTREVQIFISFLLVLQRTTSHRQLIYMNCIQGISRFFRNENSVVLLLRKRPEVYEAYISGRNF